MALPEHELERIGILASRVLDGEASEAECADLARLRSEFPEVRELCADLEAGQAALAAGAGSAPLPEGFAQQISYRAMREGAPAPLSTPRVWLYWGAAAASVAAAALLWLALDGGDDAPRTDDTAKKSAPGRTTPNRTPKTPKGGTDSLFPVRERSTPKSEPRTEDDTPTSPVTPERTTPERPPVPERPTVVEQPPTLPEPGPSTTPEREPARGTTPAPETPQPAAAVVMASFEELDGRSLAVLPAEGAEWETVGSNDLASATITAGTQVRASEGYVSLALQEGGYAALDRGAEIGFERPQRDRPMRMRVGTGRVFMDLDERAAGLTADCGTATVQIEPGSRVALDVSGGEVGVTVLEGNAVVLGRKEGDEPKRVGRHRGLKVSRHGRAGSVAKRSPRLKTHERRFVERRFQRAGAGLFGRSSGWGAHSAQIDRQAKELLAQGATPRELMPLLMKAQKLGFEGPEAVLVLRAFEAAKKAGLSREQTAHGIRRVLAQRVRHKELEGALARWLADPEGADRPGHPGKAGRGRDPRKGEKPRPPGKAGGKPGKPGAKKGMAGRRR
ncbi:MAG: hypothetical protein ACYTGX_03405 [Planctomycetota bacterium]|jgi:hypothetical protein